jgi:hypothetical protein
VFEFVSFDCAIGTKVSSIQSNSFIASLTS